MENNTHLPTTSDLFQKYFGKCASVSLSDPRVVDFFEELHQVCLEEDRRKADNSISKQ
jgi:hypothetical protein